MNIESTNENTITDQLWSVSRIKKLTMQKIHASSHQQEQVYFKKHFAGRFAVAAVLTCLIIGLSITAVATNFFGMRDMALPGPDTSYTFESTDGTVYEQPQQFITFTGFSDSPERAASIEWQEFLTTYDIEAALEIYADIWTGPQEYMHYSAYSPEMVQKIYEITQKHGLSLYGEMLDINTPKAFQENIAYGPLFTNGIASFMGYKFESGTFQFDGSYGEIRFQFRASRKGVFDRVFINIGSIDDFTGWNYTNAQGTELFLMQKTGDASFILLETDLFFVNVSIGKNTYDREALERFADSISFDQLRTDMPALTMPVSPDLTLDDNTIAAINEARTKREERIAGIIDFVGKWDYVKSESEDGAALPMFKKDWMEIDEYNSMLMWYGEGEKEFFFDIPSILLPGCRVIGGLLVKTESDEFDLKQWWAAGYSNNELPLYTAKLKLQYDSSSELMRFTDWNGIHHYFSKRQ